LGGRGRYGERNWGRDIFELWGTTEEEKKPQKGLQIIRVGGAVARI